MWTRIYILALCTAFIQTAGANEKIDFEKEKAQLKKRHQAFYSYVRKKKRDQAKIDEFAEEHSRKRVELAREYEKVRERFKKSRQAKKPNLEAERKYFAKLKKKELYQEKRAAIFAKYRKQLERVRQQTAVIPQDQEVGLENIVEDQK